MSFGQNLQFLRKMRNKMTQEELADRLGVSRRRSPNGSWMLPIPRCTRFWSCASCFPVPWIS